MRPVYGQRVNELCRVLEVPASVGICACRADTGLDRIVAGKNTVKISNLDRKKGACELRSMELALYR